jgi:raffinose/stachyose/melibiose transport system substrate-binding protein
MPIDTTDPGFTKMKGLIASNDVPEFYFIKQAYVDAAIASGQCLDLGPYADQVGFTDAVAPASVNVGTRNGQLIAFPGFTQGFAFFYYNKAIFRECGIEKAPETWDEFLSAVKAIRAKGYTPLSLFGKDQWIYSMLIDIFATRYDPMCSSKIESGELKFTDEPYLEAANKIQELALAGAFSPNVNLMDYPSAEADFLAGNTAMTLNGAWAFNMYEEKLGEDFGYLYFPAIDASQVEMSKTVWAGGGHGPDGVSVNPKKFNSEAEIQRAVQWAFYFAQATADYYGENGNPITTIKTDKVPASGFQPMMAQWIQDAAKIQYNTPQVDTCVPDAVRPDFYVLLQKLSTGTYSGADFVKDAQALVDSAK